MKPKRKQQAQQPQRQIFIGNLAYEATEQDLAKALEELTIHVFRVRVVTHQDTGKSRGIAFVDIDRDDPKSVEEIIALVNNPKDKLLIYGRPIRADVANKRPSRDKVSRPQGGRGQARNEATPLGNEFESDSDVWG